MKKPLDFNELAFADDNPHRGSIALFFTRPTYLIQDQLVLNPVASCKRLSNSITSNPLSYEN